MLVSAHGRRTPNFHGQMVGGSALGYSRVQRLDVRCREDVVDALKRAEGGSSKSLTEPMGSGDVHQPGREDAPNGVLLRNGVGIADDYCARPTVPKPDEVVCLRRPV